MWCAVRTFKYFRSLSIQQKFWFEFEGISIDEWTAFCGISVKWKRATSRGLPRFSVIPFHLILLAELREFSVERLGNLTISKFYGNFPRKYPYHLFPFEFFKSLPEWKTSLISPNFSTNRMREIFSASFRGFSTHLSHSETKKRTCSTTFCWFSKLFGLSKSHKPNIWN